MSLICIIIFSPLIAVISLLLYKQNHGRVFFRQQRPGLNNELFNIYKFKTMTDETDDNGKLLSDSLRLTNLGRIIRSLSLDELPQLFNVLLGNMSFVGPRPLLKEYLPYYSKHQLLRHSVRPGITGWAQVNGRNAITWNEKFELDLYYIKNIGIYLDLLILLKTIKKTIYRKGISSNTSDTMEDFRGPDYD